MVHLARVAAIPLLLYAHPLGRILRLTIDTTGPDVLLQMGDPPMPVPEPLAELLLPLRDQRTTCAPPPTATPAGCSPDAVPASH